MSRFLSRDFLEDRWGATRVATLADEAAGDGGDADAVVDSAIASAEALALSYLLPRYFHEGSDLLPTDPADTPAVLSQNVADLAIRDLARHHEILGDDIVRAYADALMWFKAVAARRADIGLTLSDPSVDRSAPQLLANKSITDMVFGNGGLDGW